MKKSVIMLLLLVSAAAQANPGQATVAQVTNQKVQMVAASFPIGGLIARMVSETVKWATHFLKD